MADDVKQAPQGTMLATLSPKERAELAGMGRTVLEENFLRANAVAAMQAQQAQLARLALAHLLAKHHRGLLGADGKPVELVVDLRFADTVGRLPAEFPLVHVVPLDANGLPLTVSGPAHGVSVRVEAVPTAATPEARPKVVL